jgi:tetratricopeptide (TPR) repeat protein
MKMLYRMLVLFILASTGSVYAIAASPQAELDSLFAKLRDPTSTLNAAPIEPQIWAAWMHGGTDLENQQLAKATTSMNLGAFALAEQQLTSMLATSPNYPEVWNKRATLYFLMGRMDDSLQDITKTLDLEPRHFGALTGRGMIYQRQGKNAEALAAFKEALTMNPNMPAAIFAVDQLEKLIPEL